MASPLTAASASATSPNPGYQLDFRELDKIIGKRLQGAPIILQAKPNNGL
jgi:hypothetical protein